MMLVGEKKFRENSVAFILARGGFWFWFVLTIAIFSILFGFNHASAAKTQPVLEASRQDVACPSEVELEVVTLLNQERANKNLPPLSIDMRLTDAARKHNNDLATNDFFSHTGSDGPAPSIESLRPGILRGVPERISLPAIGQRLQPFKGG